MIYVAIIVIVALVVGPVLWLLPSPRERQQMQLRQFAGRRGLQVKMSDLPQTRRARARHEPPEKGAAYRLVFKRDRQRPNQTWTLCREPGSGQWESHRLDKFSTLQQSRIMAVVSEMPPEVRAVACDPVGLTVYWHERGDEQTVDEIVDLLEQLRDVLND